MVDKADKSGLNQQNITMNVHVQQLGQSTEALAAGWLTPKAHEERDVYLNRMYDPPDFVGDMQLGDPSAHRLTAEMTHLVMTFTVCHGKIHPFLRTVNHLFLCAIYTMAMLVVTRG